MALFDEFAILIRRHTIEGPSAERNSEILFADEGTEIAVIQDTTFEDLEAQAAIAVAACAAATAAAAVAVAASERAIEANKENEVQTASDISSNKMTSEKDRESFYEPVVISPTGANNEGPFNIHVFWFLFCAR